ncbi:MAG: sodium:solute symporter [Planctomycetota bacterium]|jgi:SSS family transporter
MIGTAPSLTWPDWLVLAGYILAVLAIGLVVARRRRGRDEFFLAGRGLPMWAVAISILATSQSAATFVGGPQTAFDGDLTYLSANLAALLAVIVVAVFFIPAYYRHQVTSVYELIGHRFGDRSQRLASAMFMVGRVFASGARLFIVAIPVALIAFGNAEPGSLIVAILITAACATAYTTTGGIRAVVWTDVLQATVYVATIGIALSILWSRIPLEPGEVVAALREAGDGDKLRFLDLRLAESADLARPFSLWAIVTGLVLLNVAAFGADQDLTQRMLTCRSARSGAWSAVVSNLIGWPVVALFLVMGLLLFVYYRRPDLMGAAAPAYDVNDSRQVFLQFILHEMPAGWRGLMLAGLFAAAMSSMDSALNAMSSTAIADFYRPWRMRREVAYVPGNAREIRASRRLTLVWAALLASFATSCVFWQQRSGQTLIVFALGVMVFAYSGLLAVFLAALFTRRGNAASVAAALVAGFVSVLLLQDFAWDRWSTAIGLDVTLAFPWKMLIATGLSFGVCCLGRRRPGGLAD